MKVTKFAKNLNYGKTSSNRLLHETGVQNKEDSRSSERGARVKYEIESIDVNAAGLLPVTPEVLAERTSGIVPEPIVALARKLAAADRLVVAAPFWDMSFPAVLKTFFENMSLFGVTFTDNGETCVGLCQCKKVM